jgi:hypothetical protein
MKTIKIWLSIIMIPFLMGGSFLALAIPQTSLADDSSSSVDCSGNPGVFLAGFPAWYRGIMIQDEKNKDSCTVNNSLGISKIIWTVALNVLDIALIIVGYLSVGYIIYGGFLMMTSRGKPTEIAEGQTTVRNALIGLVISFGSVAVVNFIVGGIK